MKINLIELKIAKEVIEKRLEQARQTLSEYPLDQNPKLRKEADKLQILRNRTDQLLLEQSIAFVEGQTKTS